MTESRAKPQLMTLSAAERRERLGRGRGSRATEGGRILGGERRLHPGVTAGRDPHPDSSGRGRYARAASARRAANLRAAGGGDPAAPGVQAFESRSARALNPLTAGRAVCEGSSRGAAGAGASRPSPGLRGGGAP